MNTLHFKYAVEVERSGSITQAADNLYMGQPNLSKAIKELEDTLGIIIFNRTPKGVVATPKGEQFLKYAKNILLQIKEMKSLSENDNLDKQYFSISIPRCSYIAKAITSLLRTLDFEKEIEGNIKETNSINTINNVVEGRYNLGIIRYQVTYENYFIDYLSSKEIEYDTIWEYDKLLLMSQDNPLTNCDEVRYEDMDKYIEIVHGDKSVPYIDIEEEIKPRSVKDINKIIYIYDRYNQFDLLSNIPMTFMWVSPVPEELLHRHKLAQRRCKGSDCRYKDVLIYPKGYSFSEVDKKFMDKLYQSKNEVALNDYA